VYLRRPTEGDREEFKALRRRNRSFLERWEPIPPGLDAFADAELDRTFDRELKLRRAKSDERFLVLPRGGRGDRREDLDLGDHARGAPGVPAGVLARARVRAPGVHERGGLPWDAVCIF